MSDLSRYLRSDTVGALATPPGRGAIALIRITGNESFRIGRRICGMLPDAAVEERHAYFKRLRAPDGRDTLDEALVTFFRGPHTATGEDVVELSCHGSPAIIRRVLKGCRELGMRPAEPGEFTFRAFRSGRLDLAEAEGVAALIEGRTERARRSALRVTEGALSRELRALRDAIVQVAIEIETLVEFPDDVCEAGIGQELETRLDKLIQEATALRRRTVSRRKLTEGLIVPLLGRPNVGKSSLFNRILGQDRAIVTPHPGTTRDTIEGTIELADLPVTLVDTAGLRETDDTIERLGVDRSLETVERADIVLFVFELDRAPDDFERGFLERLLSRDTSPPILAVGNKADRVHEERRSALPEWTQLRAELAGHSKGFSMPISVSARQDDAVDSILAALEERAVASLPDESRTPYALSERQIERLETIERRLREARPGSSLPLDLLGDELRAALDALSELDGSGVRPDLFAEIFSRFCIGK